MNTKQDRLIEAAKAARTHSHAPFSHFEVGAAVETSKGDIVAACNIENTTYGLTICAERLAVFKALSEGASGFTRIAIVTNLEEPAPPCGACRQILWEFCGDIEVILANLKGRIESLRLAALLPRPFDASIL